MLAGLGLLVVVVVGLLQGFGVMSTIGMTAIVVGFILVVLGLIIGFLNVTSSEAVAVMVSVLILGLGAGVLATLGTLGTVVTPVLTNLALLAIPEGFVVAIVTLFTKLK